MLKNSNKKMIIDQSFESNGDINHEKYTNHFFTRLVAKNVKFTNVDFRYSTFDAGYIRKCTFDSCNFTGCKFIDTNLLGSSFVGCKFDYSTFERTQIDDDILESGFPGMENLQLKFARNLRINYQELGDAKSVNKAIEIELQATGKHLRKAWSSRESYYRQKYKGWKRIKIFFEWAEFKALDLIWGNGESTFKLFRFTLIVLLIITLMDVFKFGNINKLSDYINSLSNSTQVLFGIEKPQFNSTWYMTIILVTRLVLFGFFMSIIIKRFNKR